MYLCFRKKWTRLCNKSIRYPGFGPSRWSQGSSAAQIEFKFFFFFSILKLRFPNIQGRDEGFKISRRHPISQSEFRSRWLTLRLKTPQTAEKRRKTSNIVELSQPHFLTLRPAQQLSISEIDMEYWTELIWRNLSCSNQFLRNL